jgi:hypothetical protein
MTAGNTYTTMRGRKYDLKALDADERQLVDELVSKHRVVRVWTEFANFYMTAVGNFYLARGLTRRQITETPVWKIAQDLKGRLMVLAGEARPPSVDYRDELGDLIRIAFPTQREFCQATGLSEDLVSHVLSKRKHLAIDTLSDALGRIGYHLQIVPFGEKA